MTIKNFTKYLFLFSGLLFLLSATSCSTKKNTWSRRAYHNVVCHYNVFWNGGMSLNEGIKDLQKTAVDNYKEVPRVYNYGTKAEAQKLNPQMDRTIKKASVGIQRNSMYFGGKEYVKWVRRSYQMMGEAHFYKQDYTSARRVFEYVSKEYEDDPIRFEALLWLAKVYIQTERFEKAEAALNLLQSKIEENDFPLSVRKDMELVYADFYIAQKNYFDAYPHLERALELGNNREVITRTQFILGQINQNEGDLQLASEYYKSVIKRNPDYKMDFEARLNLAQCYDEGTGESKNINKVLQKMLKDFRNKEFLDQIYFALAEVAFKDKNEQLGIEYLQKSVSSSTKDNYQKTISAIQLADIYFDRQDYVNSQAYYDTAVRFIPDKFPDADRIKNKAAVLSDLITYVQTIKLQDSLLQLARLDSTSLYKLVDNLIAEYKKNKEREAEQAALESEQGGVQFVDMDSRNTSETVGGKWYFYNTTALSQGFSEFIKRWGNRKLEDNWFLTDKRAVVSHNTNTDVSQHGVAAAADSVQGSPMPTDPETRAFYLATIPSTPEQLQASTDKIIDAYHSMGYLYLEELNDTLNAKQTYLTFQEKYPDNPYRLESWYALYKIYLEENNFEKADYFKNLIIFNYPESDYANVILDPDYFIKMKEQKGESAKLYEKAYEAYNKAQYFRVITYANKAIEDFSADSSLMPRFLFLRALSIGQVQTPDSLYAALDSLIVAYPKSAVIPDAKAILRMLQIYYGLGVPEDKKTEVQAEQEKAKSLFTYNPDVMHLFIMVMNNGNIEVEPLKVRMSDFKQKYFDLKVLRIKSLMLDNQRAIITIGNFDNSSDAGDFLMAIENDEYVLSGLNATDYEMFTISVNNYPVLYREKDVKGYKEFFKENYSNH